MCWIVFILLSQKMELLKYQLYQYPVLCCKHYIMAYVEPRVIMQATDMMDKASIQKKMESMHVAVRYGNFLAEWEWFTTPGEPGLRGR